MNNTEFETYATLEIKLKEFAKIIEETYKEDFKNIKIDYEINYTKSKYKPLQFNIIIKMNFNYVNGAFELATHKNGIDFINEYTFIISDVIRYINYKIKITEALYGRSNKII